MTKVYCFSSDDRVIEILKRHRNGETMRSLAKEYGISRATIYLWTKKTGIKKRPGFSGERDWKRILAELGGDSDAR